MDPEEVIRQALTEVLESVASQARADARAGESNIGSIFDDEVKALPSLDITKVEQAIRDVEIATNTKEGARRLINGLMVVAKVAAKTFPA